MQAPHVFTIPPGVSFLDELVAALVDGLLIEGFEPQRPFALADTTLYLPTRRAARAIRERFLVRLGRPLLLPKIRTLGDIDEDDPEYLVRASATLPPAVPAVERQLVLTKLVLAWSVAEARSVAGLPDEEPLVPASPADAARLAASLASLLDQVGTEPDAWRGLSEKLDVDLARFWDITLKFLEIVTGFWPKHLADRGLIDPGVRRDLLIRAEAERLAREGSAAPVVAAGSTGSVPATAALLAAIARLPNGAVVLPGLDRGLDAGTWDLVGPGGDDPAGAGHPQYGLKLLIGTLGVRRDDVIELAQAPPEFRDRYRFVSEALRPAASAERWNTHPLDPAAKARALSAIGLIEAANEREEALAVAVLLRQAAETEGKVAALVTPDRNLARRVAIELRRWSIDVDDSAGRPLIGTPPGILSRLVAETGLAGASADTLLALLKHPLAAFGLKPYDARTAARALERAILRGPRLRPGVAALRHGFELLYAERAARKAAGERASRGEADRHLSQRKWDAARDLVARIETALAPLETFADQRDAPLAALVEAHVEALGSAARDENGRTSLFADEAGEALSLALEDLRTSAGEGPALSPADYPGLFTALIERATVRRRGGVDPRIHIWGALEARLQSVDMIVLGGLNEGTWPAQTRLDPLLSRPMRHALALDPPERRIGLAAHDFSQALGQPEVWLTRADRQDGSPAVASRWLQRLTAFAGKDLAAAMKGRGRTVLAWAKSLDAVETLDPPVRPRPSPPLELRPKQLSATRIETLIRDPYAIYAQYVLKLRPFEPLGRLPDAAERGTLTHAILERIVRELPRGPFDEAAEARLIAIGREAFATHKDFPEVLALWWPRFEKIAHFFVRAEAEWSDVLERHVESLGELQVTPDFKLTARADRLDALTGGGLAIIDYKTGAPPSFKEVRTLSPQLPLEGLIARAGGFAGLAPAEPARIVYYRLNGRGPGGECKDLTASKKGSGQADLQETLALTARRLADLVAYFASPGAEYLSNKIPKARRTYVGDYDHLARIAEWVATDEEDDPSP